jgi:hypothetical protein
MGSPQDRRGRGQRMTIMGPPQDRRGRGRTGERICSRNNTDITFLLNFKKRKEMKKIRKINKRKTVSSIITD